MFPGLAQITGGYKQENKSYAMIPHECVCALDVFVQAGTRGQVAALHTHSRVADVPNAANIDRAMYFQPRVNKARYITQPHLPTHKHYSTPQAKEAPRGL